VEIAVVPNSVHTTPLLGTNIGRENLAKLLDWSVTNNTKISLEQERKAKPIPTPRMSIQLAVLPDSTRAAIAKEQAEENTAAETRQEEQPCIQDPQTMNAEKVRDAGNGLKNVKTTGETAESYCETLVSEYIEGESMLLASIKSGIENGSKNEDYTG